ncbi:MAG: ATP-binding protein [Thermofilum sp.]|nr:ATP-binding protein [Thermofilum sp.]
MASEPKLTSGRKELGYVLSRARSSFAYFQPLKDAEVSIKEGMFVTINSKQGLTYLAEITEISHYNEYYERGEIWAEALREGLLPPEEVARRFTVAAVRILGILTQGGLANADKPPLPGDPVYDATLDDLRPLYRYDLSTGQKPDYYIEVGRMYGYESEDRKLPALIDLRNINMHFAVIGTTGSGKSNTMGKIIEKLGTLEGIGFLEEYKTIPAMIVDANGDYLDYYENPNLVKSYSEVIRLYFEGSEAENKKPFHQNSKLKNIKIDLNAFSPTEIAETIIAIYHAGKLEGAELQLNYLSTLLSDIDRLREKIHLCARSEEKIDYNCVIHEIKKLEELIEEDKETKKVHSATADAVLRALMNFHDLMIKKYKIIPRYGAKATINEDFIDEITNPKSPKLVILDFSTEGATGVDLSVKQFVVGNVLALLFKKFTAYRVKGENRLLLFVIEEAQNYAPNIQVYPVGFSVAKKILASVATQGRKFGLCLGLVTQRPSYVDPIVMSMMNTFIIHRVAPGDVRFVSTVTGGLPRYIERRLTYMEPGLAVLTGQMNVFPYPVFVKIDRRVSHKYSSLT